MYAFSLQVWGSQSGEKDNSHHMEPSRKWRHRGHSKEPKSSRYLWKGTEMINLPTLIFVLFNTVKNTFQSLKNGYIDFNLYSIKTAEPWFYTICLLRYCSILIFVNSINKIDDDDDGGDDDVDVSHFSLIWFIFIVLFISCLVGKYTIITPKWSWKAHSVALNITGTKIMGNITLNWC